MRGCRSWMPATAFGCGVSNVVLSVGVELDVTPFINPDGLVVMDINQEIDDLGNKDTIDNNPVYETTKRTLSSEIAVRDRDTILLGGFIRSEKDKGKSGVVKAVYPKESRVVVVGVNMMTRHTKPSQNDPQGGRKKLEAPLHVSNVALVDPKDKKPTRVGYKTTEKGGKVRVAKRSGEVIE